MKTFGWNFNEIVTRIDDIKALKYRLFVNFDYSPELQSNFHSVNLRNSRRNSEKTRKKRVFDGNSVCAGEKSTKN